MITESSFDDVHDCQECYRLLLYALSNPGEIVSVKEQACKLGEGNGVLLMLALTLLDKETSFFVADDEGFSKTVAELTYSKPVKDGANFIFVTRSCSTEDITDIFSGASPGSLPEPHTSSVLIITVDGFEDEPACTLKGPGIKQSKRVGLGEYAKRWIAQRDAMEYEYPMGVDLYFAASNGELMAIPRKVTMEGR